MPWWESNPKLAEIAKFSVIEDLTITAKELGRGSYGTVYAAVHNGKPCVAKEIHPYLKHDKLETFVREINTLSTLKHPSIVQFLGVHFKTKSHTPILVMELMWKSLYSLLEEQPNQLHLLTKVHILHDVTCGLQYLHSQKKPVVHRDLHPSNILLNENLNAKIADLGLAKPLHNESAQKLSTAPGNIFYMAPETLKKRPTYDTKLDVFSTGCTIIHLVTERFPAPTDQFVESKDLEGSFHKVSEADRRIEYLNLMEHVPMLQQIARHCLEDAPTNRPTASGICKMLEEYIQKLESEVPLLAKRHKQDKLSLLQLLQSQEDQLERKRKIIEDTNKDKSMLNDALMKKEEYTSSLESECQEYRSKMEKNKVVILSLNQDKESLQKELTTLKEMNKNLNTTFNNQANILREDIKAKQQEIRAADENKIQMQNDIDDLKSKLSKERLNLAQKMQLISDLETTMQKLRADADNYKEEKEQWVKANSDYAIKIKVLEQHICELESISAENDKQIEDITADRDSIIADLNEKLKIKEQQLTESILSGKDIKSKYIDLQQSYKVLQETLTKLRAENFQSMSVSKKIGDEPGSLLHKKLLELQKVNEKEHQQLQQDRQSLMVTFEQQHAKITTLQTQLVDSKKKLVALKQQIEEKSYRLSKLEYSLNELQDSTRSKEEKIKSYEENITTLNKQLENNDRIQRSFEKDLKAKGESLKRKEEELQLQKKEHADEINNLHDRFKREINDLHEDIERYKSQIVGQEEIKKLLNKEADYKSDLEKSMADRFQRLDNERKSLATSEKNLKQQIKHKDADIKDKIKQIESLETGYLKSHSSVYNYDIHWYPYLSLPVKLIRPSIAIIKGKVFVTGGYQCSPQGRRLEDYLQTVEDKSSVFCFDMAKCHCDTISSPALLGALANMNGHCVLVSGADSVGNTLSGNVYAFEEGSHDQWKEFSEPLPTPRVLACACCYGKKWLIVCGGFISKESSLLEASNVVEIFDIFKREWHTLSEENRPDCSTILSCAVIGEELYVVGSDQVIKTSGNNFIKAATSNNTLVWDNVLIETDESNGKLYPFSVVEMNGDPMIIASMSDGQDDVTCVLMKDTGGRWRIMSKAVECQHCSAAVVTSSLELLLFGGSERVSVEKATHFSQKGNCIPNLNINAEVPVERTLPAKSMIPITQPNQGYVSPDIPITINQPPNLSFTGPVHAIQFDHRGGTFQSPIHKVSLVVPPNALSDDEKVTVYMGATTTGPFDLPEDCKLRSAIVWLSVSPSDVEFKRSMSLIVPHSAVFTSPQHHSMMRFVICDDEHKGPRYKFSCSFNQYEIDGEQGVIELNDFAMVAIIAGPDFTHDQEDEGVAEGYDSDDDFQDAPEDVESLGTSNGMAASGIYRRQKSSPLLKKLKIPPACYLAKLFWPHRELPSSFKADVYYLQNLPTELYKVDTLYRSSYYEDNGSYPEIMSTQFVISGSGADLQCVIPCSGSVQCDCLTNWDVTPMNDVNKVSIERDNEYLLQYKNDPMRFSFKFNCLQPGTTCRLTCCFELHGVDHIGRSINERLPTCLQGRSYPFIVEKGIHQGDTVELQVNGDGEIENTQDNNEAGVAVRNCQPTDII